MVLIFGMDLNLFLLELSLTLCHSEVGMPV